jgi:uncharacterized protein (DUF2164 family)
MELVKIDDQAFGDLINLPRIYDDGKVRVDNAKAAHAHFIAAFNNVKNIREIKAEDMEKIMDPIRKVRGNMVALKQSLNDARKPLTKKMDDVKTAIVSLENDVEDFIAEEKKAEDNWQLELLRRQKQAAADAQTKLDDAKKKIEGIASVKRQINKMYVAYVATTLAGMMHKFKEKTADTLQAFVDSLVKWAPVAQFDLTKTGWALTGHIDWIGQAILDSKEPLALDYKARIKEAVDHLADMVPGRLNELMTGAPDTDATVPDLSDLGEMLNASVDEEVSKESMNATFETHAAVTVIAPSTALKGAKQKKKYNVTTHEGMQLIIQSWVTHNFKLLSMDELNKKLSFMRTAANERLNSGQPILSGKGIEVVDDISTRANKSE